MVVVSDVRGVNLALRVGSVRANQTGFFEYFQMEHLKIFFFLPCPIKRVTRETAVTSLIAARQRGG